MQENIPGIKFEREGNSIKRAIIDFDIHRDLFDEFFALVLQKSQNQPEDDSNLSPSGGFELKAQEVIAAARTYIGTQHSIGGVSQQKIDCSGLTFMAFQSAGIELQRSSRGQATEGTEISLSEARPGDLMFFATGSDKNRISHVGLVTKGGKKSEMEFIHTSTKRGVVEEPIFRWKYWQDAYRFTRRVIEEGTPVA